MSRRIVWTAYESGGTEASIDSYFDRLLKYIPADVVMFWLTGSNLIQNQDDDSPRLGLLWLMFVGGLVLSFFWTRKQTAEAGKPTAWRQVALSCASFAVWVFAIGGPFVGLSWYDPIIGSIVLLFYMTSIPLLPAPKQNQ
ncbi:MAG: hypothetical protein F6J87_18310 [Spirulina sp. SIO3F2]|nr:hypothetical protein [Spirulina sp. SIO3F2]